MSSSRRGRYRSLPGGPRLQILGRLASIAVLVTGLVFAPPAPGLPAGACDAGQPSSDACEDSLLILGGLEDDETPSMNAPDVAGAAIDFDDDDPDIAATSSELVIPLAMAMPQARSTERTSGSIARPRGGRSPPPVDDATHLRATGWLVTALHLSRTVRPGRPTPRSAPSAAVPSTLVDGRARGRSDASSNSESLLVPAPPGVDAGPDRAAAPVCGRFPARWEVQMASG